MIASLQMYQRPELIDAHNEYWDLIRQNLNKVGVEAPTMLSQDADEMTVWQDPNLVLSQTCGMPYRKFLHEKVSLVGTTDFGVEDCPPGYYRSAAVTHKNDKRTSLIDYQDALFTFNDLHSQSGLAAAYHDTRKLGFFFKKRIQSGAHRNSARMVANGEADIAYIDAVSLKLLSEYDVFYKELRIIGWSEPTPSLPYITAKSGPADKLFAAVSTAIQQLSPIARQKLHLKKIIKIPSRKYLSVPNPPSAFD